MTYDTSFDISPRMHRPITFTSDGDWSLPFKEQKKASVWEHTTALPHQGALALYLFSLILWLPLHILGTTPPFHHLSHNSLHLTTSLCLLKPLPCPTWRPPPTQPYPKCSFFPWNDHPSTVPKFPALPVRHTAIQQTTTDFSTWDLTHAYRRLNTFISLCNVFSKSSFSMACIIGHILGF